MAIGIFSLHPRIRQAFIISLEQNAQEQKMVTRVTEGARPRGGQKKRETTTKRPW